MEPRWSAAFGLVAWAAFVAWQQPALGVALMLLGPLVAVPLALGLAQPGGPQAPSRGRWRVVGLLQPAAGLGVLASFSQPVGPVAAALVLPWLAFTAAAALLALLRAVEHGFRRVRELALDAGLAFLLVGGFWLVFSRWGQPFLGFGEPIMFLTAAHFHFAGIALPVLGGLAARAKPGRFGTAVAGALAVGIPFVATGITLQPQGIEWVNQAAVLWLVAACLGLSVQHARLALAPGPMPSRLLWGLSAAALPVGMALAAVWALGPSFGVHLTIDQMIRSHAVVNIFGFALPALLAWTVAGVPRPEPAAQLLLPGERLDVAAFRDAPLHPQGGRLVQDDYRAPVGQEPPGPPVPGGPFERAATAVLAYRIFPESVVRPAAVRVPVQPGDTMALVHPLAPGLRLGFAARVLEVFDGPADGGGWRKGFTYATVEGHPERGTETFEVRKHPDGHVELRIEARSQMATPLMRAVRPIARRRQLRAARAAIEGFASRL